VALVSLRLIKDGRKNINIDTLFLFLKMESTIIDIKDLHFKYADGTQALRGINLEIKKGEFLGIVGPTGAGKTTLLRCIMGLIPHSIPGELKGDVITCGMNTKEYPPAYIATKVGMVFEQPDLQLIGITVEDEFAMGPENHGIPPHEIDYRIKWALDVVRLAKYRYQFPGYLSGGQKQRAAIGSMLTILPEVLLLDEVTSQLDPIGKNEVFSTIAELKKRLNLTIVMVEHQYEMLAEFADRIILMNDGKIIREGAPNMVLTDTDLLIELGLEPPEIADAYRKISSILHTSTSYGIPITLEQGITAFTALQVSPKWRPPIDLPAPKIKPRPVGNVIIYVENLWFSYAKDSEPVLKGINLAIREGEFVGIVGQNGSGKTTLVKHFNGLLKPTSGKVIVFGRDTKKATVAELSKKVGYCFQNPDHQLFEETVRKELSFAPLKLGKPRDIVEHDVKRALQQVGLPLSYLDKDPFELNLGEKKLLTLAIILVINPDVIIVDEPTTGLDWKSISRFMDVLINLYNNGKTIIIISHDMRVIARYTTRAIAMHEGSIILDLPTRQFFTKTNVLKEAFLEPPFITKLAQSLKGFPENILCVDEFVKCVVGD